MNNRNYSWVFLSLLTCTLAALAIILLFIISKTNYHNTLCLCYTFILVGLLSIFYIIVNYKSNNILLKSIKRDFFYIIIVLSLIIFLKGILLQKTLIKISDFLYIDRVIIRLNIILSLLAIYFFFKNKFNIQSLIGMLMSLIGLSIVIYYSNI